MNTCYYKKRIVKYICACRFEHSCHPSYKYIKYIKDFQLHPFTKHITKLSAYYKYAHTRTHISVHHLQPMNVLKFHSALFTKSIIPKKVTSQSKKCPVKHGILREYTSYLIQRYRSTIFTLLQNAHDLTLCVSAATFAFYIKDLDSTNWNFKSVNCFVTSNNIIGWYIV